MTIYVMHREVCLKHRKNRREILLRVRTQSSSWQRCLFFLSNAARGRSIRYPRRSFAFIVQEQDA